MGRASLVCRLAGRDLRRRPAEAALLVMAIVAATTLLTIGLLLHGVTTNPYNHTRKETKGPDVVASATPLPNGRPADLAALHKLARAQGVLRSTGPFPLVEAMAQSRGHRAPVQLEGRSPGLASVDMPKLTQGGWVRPGGVVVERSFADAFGLNANDRISLDGHTFTVVGVAVTAAMPPYPFAFCLTPCAGETPPAGPPFTGAHGPEARPGLMWLNRADLGALAPASTSYVVNLKLANPSTAQDFVNRESSSGLTAPALEAWQDLSADDANLIRNERRVVLVGSSLLTLLALASIAVLVGGRMADQIRRVGALKAVGATPGFIAAVLLSEYLALALGAAVVGLALGRLAAPLLTSPGAGLLGAASVQFTSATAVVVISITLSVAALATFVPAWRSARTSTVLALADSARTPRRTAWAIAISARLSVPLMLGLRMTGRRPRRAALCALSVMITVAGIVAVLAGHAQLTSHALTSAGLANPRTDRLNQVLLTITLMLIALAAVNVLFIAWATALDAKHSSALERALGATPRQASLALSAAQVLPALAGAILGLPAGVALFDALSPTEHARVSLLAMAAVLIATPLAVGALTAIPARIGARQPAAEVLRSEFA